MVGRYQSGRYRQKPMTGDHLAVFSDIYENLELML